MLSRKITFWVIEIISNSDKHECTCWAHGEWSAYPLHLKQKEISLEISLIFWGA
jgi:hypothetical protein